LEYSQQIIDKVQSLGFTIETVIYPLLGVSLSLRKYHGVYY